MSVAYKLPTDRLPLESDFEEILDLDQFSAVEPSDPRSLDCSEQQEMWLGEAEERIGRSPFRTAVILNGTLTPNDVPGPWKDFTAFNRDLTAARLLQADGDPRAAPAIASVVGRYNQRLESGDAEERASRLRRRSAVAIEPGRFPVPGDFDEVVDLDVLPSSEQRSRAVDALEDKVTHTPYNRVAATLNGILTPWSWLFGKEQFLMLNHELVTARQEIAASESVKGTERLSTAMGWYNRAEAADKPEPSGVYAASRSMLRQIRFDSLESQREAFWREVETTPEPNRDTVLLAWARPGTAVTPKTVM